MQANIVDKNKVYFALAPDFMQRKGDKCLLIWSFLPHWIIVNNQILKLLTCFDGIRTLQEIIDITQGLSDTPSHQYEQNVKKLVTSLLNAKILSDKPKKLVLDDYEDISSSIIEELTVAFNDLNNEDTVLTTDEMKSIIKNIGKYLKANAILHIISKKPLKDIDKLKILLKNAIYKGLNTILDLPVETYTEEFMNEIAKMRLQVDIKFDGAVPDINDAIQGPGSFERNIIVLKELTRRKIGTIVTLKASEHNYQDIENLLRILNNLNVNECRIVPLKKISTYKDFRTPDYREILTYIINVAKKNPLYSRLLGRGLLAIYDDLIKTNMHVGHCGAGIKKIFIGADGNVYPCKGYNIKGFEVGNLKESTIDEIWENSNDLNTFRENCGIKEKPQCAKCVIRFWCRGGCSAETYVNTANEHNPSIACKSIQTAFIDLFWQSSDYEEITKPKQPYC